MQNMIVTLLLVVAAVPAIAQTPQDGPPPRPMAGGMAMRADTNGDGVVTRAEVVAEAGARFDRADANRDGKLDREEVVNMRRGGGGPPPRAQQ